MNLQAWWRRRLGDYRGELWFRPDGCLPHLVIQAPRYFNPALDRQDNALFVDVSDMAPLCPFTALSFPG